MYKTYVFYKKKTDLELIADQVLDRLIQTINEKSIIYSSTISFN